MFFCRMIARSLSRQLLRRSLIAITVALATVVCISMLGITLDVADKLNAELSSYGSNIMVKPRSNALVDDLYGLRRSSVVAASAPGTQDGQQGQSGQQGQQGQEERRSQEGQQAQQSRTYLHEDEVARIKTIFWAFNITNMAPTLSVDALVSRAADAGSAGAEQAAPGAVGQSVRVVGAWFNKHLDLPTGEQTVVGLSTMRSWFHVEGSWPNDCDVAGGQPCQMQALVGRHLAQQLGVHVGDAIRLDTGNGGAAGRRVIISGVFSAGADEEQDIYVPLALSQQLLAAPNAVGSIEVKALTTPENDLARKAARNPKALSAEEWETWYCTAYPSAIAYQIEEVIPGAVAKQVRQVAALQAQVLSKTQLVMILMAVVSLIAACIAVGNLMVSSIQDRRSQLALLKAVGASDGAVIRLMLAEHAVIALVGALVGSGLGVLVAQLVCHVVFHATLTLRPMVFVLVAVLLCVTLLVASIAAMRAILRLRPGEVLHGR